MEHGGQAEDDPPQKANQIGAHSPIAVYRLDLTPIGVMPCLPSSTFMTWTRSHERESEFRTRARAYK